MSAMTLEQRATHERNSFLLVLLFALISLAVGWGVKTAVQDQTRPFSSHGISAEIPAGWLVQEGAGDLIFVARNPQAMDQRYRVQLLTGDSDLTASAQMQIDTRRQRDDSFRILEETPIVVDGQDGYKVSYAYVDAAETGMPSVIEGVDYYFPSTDATLVISYESDHEDFANTFSQFQQFRASVSVQAGG
ncbi:MAG: hypothetical protein GY943_16960 [Chloroflexi bacterium]|nr:hypothetical protein [Chloroflexota bacterium]